MTNVFVSSKKIIVEGHSGYETRGKDIVCAFISTLTYSTYNYLLDAGNDVEMEENDARIEIKINKLNDVGKRMIKSFHKMVKEVENDYKKYIRSCYNEEIREIGKIC